MENFIDWVSKRPKKLPWLVIGKGPTFEKLDAVNLADYQTIALNHTVKEVACDIFHLIDLDVLDGIEVEADKNANFILMPYYPHINNKAGDKSLDDLLNSNNFLKKMDNEGRLLWYNASTSRAHKAGYPIVTVRYFSADAVVSLLASAGIKKILSVGIDGGVSYNKKFSYLNDKTLLSNNRASFNAQFIAIANTLEKYDAEFIPLGEETIRIYVGTQAEQWLATKILEYSVLSRTSASIKVISLHENKINIPLPKKKENRPRTPFSFQRFLIPELAGHEGKAIYVDSDMQVFTDIRDLYDRQFVKKQNLLNVWDVSDNNRRPQFSVMLLDCYRLKWDIKDIVKQLDSGALNYEQLMFDMAIGENKGNSIEQEWNSLEYYDAKKTKLLHYTDMHFQPWLSKKNHNASIWVEDLIAAIKYEHITKKEIRKDILSGNIRPSLMYQINTGLLDSRKIPVMVGIVDVLFTPPHKQKYFFHRSQVFKTIKGAMSLAYVMLVSFAKPLSTN